MIELALTFIAGMVVGSQFTVHYTEGTIMHRIRTFMFGSRKRKVISLAALLALTASAAVAAWIISGSGDGSGRVGSLQPVTFTAGPTAGNPGYPGVPGDISMTVHNPNGPLVLTAISPGGPSVGSCQGTGSSGGAYVRGRSVNGLSIPVPAGNSDIVVPDGVMIDSDAPQSCAGATFTIPFDGSLRTP